MYNTGMNQFHDDDTTKRLADLRKRGEETLMQSLAPQYGLTYVDLHGVTINPEALMKISEVKARQANMIAFALTSVISLIADFILRATWFRSDDRENNSPVVMIAGIVAALVAPLATSDKNCWTSPAELP